MRNADVSPSPGLSTPGGIALYVGALLGPGLLLLPGLAVTIAGPAAVLAWLLLLGLSGLLAAVFLALGRSAPGAEGVVGYARAGLGAAAARVVGWCFLAGVVLGAPVVCLIGAAYVADLVGGGRTGTVLVAAGLLAVVVAGTLAGRSVSGRLQLGLVALLVVLVGVATVGAAPHARAEHWAPFAPHGWWAIGRAAAVLMLSFVGWEAVSPLIARLRDPGRQLPQIIGAAFAVTAAIYLGLAVVTVAVLGDRAGSGVPLAELLDVAIGGAGRYLAAGAAVALTLAATNAYLSGAAELADRLRVAGRRRTGPDRRLQLAIAGVGLLVLGLAGSGAISLNLLVALPTSMFVAVYAVCTAAAARLLRGTVRVLAGIACAVVVGILGFSGWALLAVAAVAAAATLVPHRPSHRARRPAHPPLTGCGALHHC
ncbi:MAG TPA: amino acid permease [Pseudonocardia sp.]|nr:amino acid permease [Pseudonocardia sp.]